MLNTWKKTNRAVSGQFIGSQRYWQKSPSNILLYRAAKEALRQHAKGKIVLDLGAGRLAYRELISLHAKKYLSSDFKQTHPELDVVTNIEKMSLKNASVEVVFCSQVLEHVPHPWLAMAEIHRVLKKNGIVIITVPHLGYLHNLPYDFYRYTGGGLRSLAEFTGFKVLDIRPLGGFFCFLGYIRSTLLMPVMSLPLLGDLVLKLNYLFGLIDIALDKLTRSSKIFPLNFLMIAKKS